MCKPFLSEKLISLYIFCRIVIKVIIIITILEKAMSVIASEIVKRITQYSIYLTKQNTYYVCTLYCFYKKL